MSWFVAEMVVLAIIVLVVLKRLSRVGPSAELLPYSKATALFSPAERSFYGVLTQAVGKDFCVFGKVRVADVLTVNGGMTRSAWKTAFNRINAKHFDFVLCSPTDLSVLCVIELNDASHARKNRQDRDDFLAAACKVARLPLVVVQARAAYSPIELSRLIAEALVPNTTDSPVREPVIAADDEPPTPLCPKCSSAMTRRTVTSGRNAGREFWGCSRFPSCSGVVAA